MKKRPLSEGARPIGNSSDESLFDLLGELGRATTAYHEATPDRFETARQDYEQALLNFKNHTSQPSTAEPGQPNKSVIKDPAA